MNISASQNNGRYPSWQWIAVTLVAILIGVSGYLYAGLAGTVSDLGREKLDKEIYYRDMDRIEGKVDRVLNILIRHQQETDRPFYGDESGE